MPANIYKTKDGTLVPGVTTIIGQLNKPALIQWAWKLGKEGKDWKEELNSAGDIGTLVHEMVHRYWSGEYLLRDEFGDVEWKCFEKFLGWVEDTRPLQIFSEVQFVSEKLGFGGQIDCLVKTYEGRLRLPDIKTSNGIYDSFWLQLAGYDILLRENGYKVNDYQILWLPKDDRFDCPIRTDLRKEKKIFRHLLEIWKLKKEG